MLPFVEGTTPHLPESRLRLSRQLSKGKEFIMNITYQHIVQWHTLICRAVLPLDLFDSYRTNGIHFKGRPGFSKSYFGDSKTHYLQANPCTI